jgi:hypothetical protein
MATELLAIGTAPASSADITLAAGESAHIHLRGNAPPAVPPCTVSIEIKGSDGGYTELHRLNSGDISRVIDAVGVYRVRRSVCEQGVGVDRD